jgi:thiol-disulfide isomerase/thioredoxin
LEAVGITKVGPAKTPGFKLENMEGAKVSLDDYKGRVVLLNFWATWCPPCKEEMPAMENLHKEFHSKGLSIVAIDDYEKRETVEKFLKKNPYTFDILLDPTGKTSEAFKAMMLPTSFIIDKEGNAIGKVVGMREWDGEASKALFKELLNR